MIATMQGAWTHERIKPRLWQPTREIDVTWMQPKEDGWRVTFYGQPGRERRALCFGRLLEADCEMSHLLDWHPAHRTLQRTLGAYSSVDGEMHVLGRPAACVPTAMRERWPELRFTAFAVPWCSGVEGACRDRDQLYRACDDLGVEVMPTLEMTGHETYDGLLKLARDLKIEGWVLKRDLAESHRSDWWKLKVTRTIDLVCTGLKPGKGKFAGQVGSVLGSVYRTDLKTDEVMDARERAALTGDWESYDAEMRLEVACCSGMDDATRAAITSEDVGRAFECEYDRVDAGGRLRHPRFVRWRDDKPKRECTDEQLRE